MAILWRLALLFGFIYALGEFWGWYELENFGRLLVGLTSEYAADLGITLSYDGMADWWRSVRSYFPESWPSWAIALGLLFTAVVAIQALAGAKWGKGVLWVFKWLWLLPYRAVRRFLLLLRSPFGKSKFATLRDLRRAGMLEGGGLFLGQFRQNWRKRFDLFHHGEGHFITIAAPGGGKTSAALVPPLLTARSGSFIVTDPKGEITAITRRYREKRGRVIYLNPFFADFERDTGLVYPDSGFNPLTMIEVGENTRAQADVLARLLCVTDRKESGSYFQDEGAELLSLFITWMVKYEPPENQTLTYLYELVRRDPEQVFAFMLHQNDPHISYEAGRFAQMFKHAPPQWTGAISKAQLATKRYVPETPLGRHVEKSGLDPSWLKTEDVTIYVLLPTQHVKTGAPWLNMVMGLLGEAVGRAGKARPVTMLLDELPALGFLPDLRAQMRQYRGSGLRMWLFSQTTAALSDPAMYGRAGLDDLFGLCDTKQFFAVREYKVAAEISKFCGETSRFNRSQQSRDEEDSISVQGVPLIRPEEILRLKAREQIIIRRDLVIKARLVPYFTRLLWRQRTDKNPYRG